jgi:hypothetical protein
VIAPAWMDPGLRVRSDPPRRAERRLLQGWWRETELGVPPGRDERGVLRNNMLPVSAVQSDPGLNFLDPAVSAYAQHRAPTVIRLDGTLDEDRLYRNLLSSMPMCFNLFGMFRAHPGSAARVLSSATGLDVADIQEIEVEWIPDGVHPLGDRTAFDAWVHYTSSTGRHGFFGVETKYTEPFSQRVYLRDRYTEVTHWPESGFMPEAVALLSGSQTNQLWRNALLAAAVRREGSFDDGHVLVVALDDDPHVHEAMDVFNRGHREPESLVRVAPIERLVELSRVEPALSAWSARFARRYIDLSPLRSAI